VIKAGFAQFANSGSDCGQDNCINTSEPGIPGILQRNGAATSTMPGADWNTLITGAAEDLADYQRLTAEGKLGEAGQKLGS
jgi:hypothetical protein